MESNVDQDSPGEDVPVWMPPPERRGLPRAPLHDRLVAWGIDQAFTMSLLGASIQIGFWMQSPLLDPMRYRFNQVSSVLDVEFLFVLLGFIAPSLVAVALVAGVIPALTGRTLGKWLLQIRVIDVAPRRFVWFRHGVIRPLVGMNPLLLVVMDRCWDGLGVHFAGFAHMLHVGIFVLLPVLALHVFSILGSEERSLADVLAGTRVVYWPRRLYGAEL